MAWPGMASEFFIQFYTFSGRRGLAWQVSFSYSFILLVAWRGVAWQVSFSYSFILLVAWRDPYRQKDASWDPQVFHTNNGAISPLENASKTMIEAEAL